MGDGQLGAPLVRLEGARGRSHLSREVELAADLLGRLEEGDLVASARGGGGEGKARDARAHDGEALRAGGRLEDELRLVAGARVDEARGAARDECVVEARLPSARAGR